MNRMGDPNVTENKVEPATDEEIETAQRLSALNIACPPWDVLALIDRIDAECTRADEAETRVEELELDAEKVAAWFEGDESMALGMLANVFAVAFLEWAEPEERWFAYNADTAIPDIGSECFGHESVLQCGYIW